MNRRMIRAKAARKWHAAHQRQVLRFVNAAMARMADSLAHSIQAHATLGEAMRDAARAVQGFMVEALAQRAVRQVMASLPCFHSGGFVGGMARPGEVHAVILPPGQLFARERGSSAPPELMGTTGPITLQVGSPQPLATSTWNATRCTCEPNPDGDRCEYCDAWLAGQA